MGELFSMSTTGALSTTILYLVRMEINHPTAHFSEKYYRQFDRCLLITVDMNTYDANDRCIVVHIELVSFARRARGAILCANIPPFSSHEELQSTQRDGNSNPAGYHFLRTI